MIDIDGLDYCRRCSMALLLAEAARDARKFKPTTVLRHLAQTSNVMAVCVLWTPSDSWTEDPPHCPCQRDKQVTEGCDHGVGSMRVKRVYPDPTDYVPIEPYAFARWIDRIHADHERSAHALGVAA